ncbi:aldo/keto reductase family protein [[Mycoplasma] testudinis]|uniref:aldo/keto reductase family protein n=1 Tax=[Mycoplasma] testudinis TaxID=33924 RepID=UPI0004820F34|nr:aldo/keto reductase [[Mycoplasma] testudinis]
MNQKLISQCEMGFGTYKNHDNGTAFLKNLEIVCGLKQYQFIDTARLYKNEKAIGYALSKIPPIKKENILIQSKVWTNQFHQVKKELIKSLTDLRLLKLDSYLLHRPHWDMKVNIKAWQDLIKCQQQGLVTEIGVSNFDYEMIMILYNKTGVMPAINQIELSVSNMRWDRIFNNKKLKIVTQSWRPLTNDFKSISKNPLIVQLSKKYKVAEALILVAFLKNLKLCPIVKSQNQERIIENAKAFEIKLSEKEIAQLQKLNIYISASSSTYSKLK